MDGVIRPFFRSTVVDANDSAEVMTGLRNFSVVLVINVGRIVATLLPEIERASVRNEE
jgi:hypothetical protein